MNPELDQRAAELFIQGLDYSPTERAAFLQRACAGDSTLLAAVEALAAADVGTTRTSGTPCEGTDPAPTDRGNGARVEFTETSARPAGAGVFPEIEGYEMTRLLGRGGMGVVYEATESKLRRSVALKLLPGADVSHRPELAARFQREAAAVASLHHPNIAPIYHFGVCSAGYYFAMEFIEGQTLAALIRQVAQRPEPFTTSDALVAVIRGSGSAPGSAGPKEPEPRDGSADASEGSTTRGRLWYRQVARWTADAADALYHAHLQGLVHRDIKPSNLMVRRDGRIVLLDFGLVKAAGDPSITSRGDILGTLRYMGPERQVGAKRSEVDARTDVYSLGATLYELLTLRPAFSSVEEAELVSDILFRDPALPRKLVPSIPSDLQTICLKAMEKDPRARYQTARVMADDLRRYLDDLPIVARPPGRLGRTWKFLRRRRAVALTGASILLAVGAVIATALISRHERDRRVVDLLQHGLRSMNAAQLDEAESAYRQVLDLDPSNYEALINLGIVRKDQYYRRLDPRLLDEAERLLRLAAAADPAEVKPWTLLGILLRNRGHLLEALEAHEQARKLSPKDFTNYVNEGAIYAMLGNLAEAEKELLEGVRLAEGGKAGPMPWRHLAAVQMQLGKLGDARRALTEAAIRGENDEASVLLQTALDLQSGTPSDLEAALDNAKFAYRKAFISEGKPSADRQDYSFLALMNRVVALAYLRNARWDQAVAAGRYALDHGDSPPAYGACILAIAEARRGNFSTANRYYEAAVKAWPEELQARGFQARMEGVLLWIDSAQQLQQLRDEAQKATAAGP